MEPNPIRMCELLVGLLAVNVLGVVSRENERLHVHVERVESVTGCPACGVVAHVTDRRRVEWVKLVDLPSFGRPTRLFWQKRHIAALNRAVPMAPGPNKTP